MIESLEAMPGPFFDDYPDELVDDPEGDYACLDNKIAEDFELWNPDDVGGDFEPENPDHLDGNFDDR